MFLDGLAAHNPPHGRIASETVGIVHVFIAAKASKHRLTELTRHAVPSVLAGTAVLENISGNRGQAKGIVKPPISEQPCVGGDLGTVRFLLRGGQNRPKSLPSRFTHRVGHASRSINTSTN